jgi:uncharacterized protein (TIGR00730 family)
VVKRITVFCGSSPGRDPGHIESARKLGSVMAGRGIGLVYGGASVGLMGALADAALASGGEVIGVIPRALVEMEVAHRGLADLRVVETMHERKALMAGLSDAFIALPGGAGTMEELFEIWTWALLGIHRKPLGILDGRGYYDHLLAFVDHAVREGFLKERHRRLLLTGGDPGELIDRLASFHAPPEKMLLDLDRS